MRELAQARVNLANAETEHEKVSANERIKALESQRDVLIAETKSPWISIARFAFIIPIAFYINKLIMWDKIACPFLYGDTCTTAGLSEWLYGVAAIVIGFLFLDNSLKIIKR